MMGLRPLNGLTSRTLHRISLIRHTSTSTAAKPISPHVGYYKTFARPVGKVLLMATFVYQVTYWTWVKLEKDEIKVERNAEIEQLEKQLRELTKGKRKGGENRDQKED